MEHPFTGTVRVAVFADPHAADVTFAVTDDTDEAGRRWARNNRRAVEQALWPAVTRCSGPTSGTWQATVAEGRLDAVTALLPGAA